MTQAQAIPQLSSADLDGLAIGTIELCDVIEEMIAAQAVGAVQSAPKAMLRPGDGRYMMSTMAAADGPGVLVVKTLVQNPENVARGLPGIDGLVTVLDTRTGQPLAVIDGPWVTAMRTAGLSAVAARRMAPQGARVIAVIGTGVQAQSHLRAMADLFALGELRIVGRRAQGIARLAALGRDLGLRVVPAETPRAALAGADIVVSAVSQTAPFLRAAWLARDCFATLADLGKPWQRDSLAALDCVVVDDLAQEAGLPEAARLIPPGQAVAGDLADLVAGRIGAGRLGAGRRAFVFRGHALGDLALAVLVLRKAGLLAPGR